MSEFGFSSDESTVLTPDQSSFCSEKQSFNEHEEIEFDIHRIPPNYIYSPDLDCLPADHQLTRAWLNFHYTFHRTIGRHARGIIAGRPCALRPLNDEEVPIPIFAIYMTELDISRTVWLETIVNPITRVMLNFQYSSAYKVPIRIFELAFNFHDPCQSAPKQSFLYEHNSKSRMGHSVGISGLPNAGTIFGFVALYDKITGHRVPGEFALLPSSVAGARLPSITLGKNALRRLQSPALVDNHLTIQNIGRKIMKTREEIQGYASEARSEETNDSSDRCGSVCGLFLHEDKLEEFCNMNMDFGEVVYASGIRTERIVTPDEIDCDSHIDFALVKLASHRTGHNSFPKDQDKSGLSKEKSSAYAQCSSYLEGDLGHSECIPLDDFSPEVLHEFDIIKYGSSTRVTEGQVQAIRQFYFMKGREYADPCVWGKRDTEIFSAAGDSGAPIVNKYRLMYGHEVVGMLLRSTLCKKKLVKDNDRVKSWGRREVAFFMRWDTIVDQIEKHTKWKVAWLGMGDPDDIKTCKANSRSYPGISCPLQ